MSAHVDISNPRDAAILVSALLAQCANERFRTEAVEQALRNAEASRDLAWSEAGAATATICEMRSQLEAAEQRARGAAPAYVDARGAIHPGPPGDAYIDEKGVPRHEVITPKLRAALVQLLTRIKGRGDAGHLLNDVHRIESILRDEVRR